MPTSGQCVLAAYLTDGDILCPECVHKKFPDADPDDVFNRLDEEFYHEHDRQPDWGERRELEKRANEIAEKVCERNELRPLIQYDLDSDETFQKEGLFCGSCGNELVEPYEEPEEYTEEAQDMDEWHAKEHDHAADEDCAQCRAQGHVPPQEEKP